MDLTEEVHEVKKQVASIAKNVDSVLSLLTGNEYDVTMGLLNRFAAVVTKVQVLEKTIEDKDKKSDERFLKIEKWKDRIIWTGVGVGITSGGSIWFILSKIFGK